MTIQELEQKLNECQKELAELKESKKEGKWKPKSAEECERYWHFMDTVKEKSYEFSDLDWRDDDIVKWVIEYDYLCKQLRVGDHRYIKHFGLIYFKDKESAQYIIDNFKDELMEYWI